MTMFESSEDKERTNVLDDTGTNETMNMSGFEGDDDPTTEQPAIDAKDGGEGQPKRPSNRRKIAIGAAIVAVVAGLGIGVWALSGAQPQASEPAADTEEQEATEQTGTGIVRFGIDAPNWNEESSPFIAHVTGETHAGESVDFYHAVWADGSTDTVELDDGTYQVTWTSAINADGSIYRTPEDPAEIIVGDEGVTDNGIYDDTDQNADASGSETVATTDDNGVTDQTGTTESGTNEAAGDAGDVANSEQGQDAADTTGDQGATDESQDDGTGDATEDAGDEDATDVEIPIIDTEGSFEQVPAEDVTQDDLDQILGDIEQAVGNGDETLSGDAGQTVVDTATGNASNNPNAEQEKVEQAGETASGNVSETPQTPSSGGSTGGSTSTGSSGSGSGGNTGGNTGSSSGGGSTQVHTHNWVAQTTQQWVQDSAAWSEQVWVQDSAAWTETVQTGEQLQCSCGATFSSNSEWSAHNKEVMISQGVSHRYSVVPTYSTVYHEATGHYETVNHEAIGHYETVTTGYKCSTCGATR